MVLSEVRHIIFPCDDIRVPRGRLATVRRYYLSYSRHTSESPHRPEEFLQQQPRIPYQSMRNDIMQLCSTQTSEQTNAESNRGLVFASVISTGARIFSCNLLTHVCFFDSVRRRDGSPISFKSNSYRQIHVLISLHATLVDSSGINTRNFSAYRYSNTQTVSKQSYLLPTK